MVKNKQGLDFHNTQKEDGFTVKVKILSVLIVLLFVTSFMAITGCETEDAETGTETGETIELEFATFWPAVDFQVEEGHKVWAAEISERVSAETPHTVEFNWYYAGQLLDAEELYSGAADGVADIVSTCPAYTPGVFPVTEAFELPGYNNDNAVVASVAMHEAWKQSEIIQQEYEDVKVMHFWATGPGDFITNTPVRSMEDLDGLPIRAVGGTIPWVDALGADPVSFPMSASYENIETGVVDGLLAPTDVLKGFGLYEITQYITKSPPTYNIVFMKVMNRDKWDSLPEDVQDIFDEVNEEYVMKYGELRADHTIHGQEFAVEQGHEVIELDEDEYQRWVEPIDQIYDDWIRDTDENLDLDMSGEEIIEMIRGFDEKYSDMYGDYSN